MHGKTGKVRILKGGRGDRGGIYLATIVAPIVEGVETEGRRGGGTSKASRKGQYGQGKEKYCIIVLDLVGAMPALPKDADVDAEKGNGGW